MFDLASCFQWTRRNERWKESVADGEIISRLVFSFHLTLALALALVLTLAWALVLTLALLTCIQLDHIRKGIVAGTWRTTHHPCGVVYAPLFLHGLFCGSNSNNFKTCDTFHPFQLAVFFLSFFLSFFLFLFLLQFCVLSPCCLLVSGRLSTVCSDSGIWKWGHLLARRLPCKGFQVATATATGRWISKLETRTSQI